MRFFLIFLYMLGLNAQAVSFDCSKADNEFSRTVCSNDDLSHLDDELFIVYKSIKSYLNNNQPGDVKKLQATQIDWLKNAVLCKTDPECSKSLYQSRLKELKSLQESLGLTDNNPDPSNRTDNNNLGENRVSSINKSERIVFDANDDDYCNAVLSDKNNNQFVELFYKVIDIKDKDDATIYLNMLSGYFEDNNRSLRKWVDLAINEYAIDYANAMENGNKDYYTNKMFSRYINKKIAHCAVKLANTKELVLFSSFKSTSDAGRKALIDAYNNSQTSKTIEHYDLQGNKVKEVVENKVNTSSLPLIIGLSDDWAGDSESDSRRAMLYSFFLPNGKRLIETLAPNKLADLKSLLVSIMNKQIAIDSENAKAELHNKELESARNRYQIEYNDKLEEIKSLQSEIYNRLHLGEAMPELEKQQKSAKILNDKICKKIEAFIGSDKAGYCFVNYDSFMTKEYFGKIDEFYINFSPKSIDPTSDYSPETSVKTNSNNIATEVETKKENKQEILDAAMFDGIVNEIVKPALKILIVIIFFSAIQYALWLRFKNVDGGVIVDKVNRTLEFPGGSIYADSLSDYLAKDYLLQAFIRFTINIDEIRQIKNYSKVTTSREYNQVIKQYVTTTSTTYFIDLNGDFGSFTIPFDTEGKRDQLYALLREINAMGEPVFLSS